MYNFQAPDMTARMGDGLAVGASLYQFQQQKRVGRAREALYTTPDGSPEQQQAYATLMAHDPDYLQQMAQGRFRANEEQRKAETHGWDRQKAARDDASGRRKALGDLSRVMVQHADTLLSLPPGDRLAYIERERGPLEQMAPDLRQGFDKIMADGRVDDAELQEFKRLVGAHGNRPEHYVTGPDNRVRAYDPNTGTSADTGLVQREGRGVSVNVGAEEGAFEKERGKRFGAMAAAMGEDGFDAQRSNNLLNQVETLLDQGVETGSVESLLHPLKAILADVGFEFDDDLPLQEAMNSLSVDLALGKVNQTKGPVSDREMALFIRAVPGLARSPEGNRLIIEFMRARNNIAIEMGMAASAATSPQEAQAVSERTYAMPADLMRRIEEFNAPARDISSITLDELGNMTLPQLEALEAEIKARQAQ